MYKKKYFYLILIFLNFISTQVKSESLFELGKDIFLKKAECSSCHILADAGSGGQIGPNLNQVKPNKVRVLTAVTNGIGIMPAYQGYLSEEEIDAVSHYVSISASQ